MDSRRSVTGIVSAGGRSLRVESTLERDFATLCLFAEFVVNEYHKKVHRGIGMSPLEKWWEGINGDDRKRKGTGLPPPIADPMRDEKGFLWSLQTIKPDGSKLFMKDGLKSGLMHVIKGKAKGPTIVAEGYATAASRDRQPVQMAV